MSFRQASDDFAGGVGRPVGQLAPVSRKSLFTKQRLAAPRGWPKTPRIVDLFSRNGFLPQYKAASKQTKCQTEGH